MRQVTFQIDSHIFNRVPGYRRAIVIVTGIDNTIATPQLTAEIARQAQTIQEDVTTDDPRIVAWREAFRSAGIKPNDFRPSIDALVRRILNDKPLGSINPVVDIGTIISLKYVLPAGAHPLLSDSTHITLKQAALGEFTVQEDGQLREIPANEVVLVDTGRVATRRWAWRQTELSRIDHATSALYLNIDALDCIDDQTLQAAVANTQQLLNDVFGVNAQVITLDASSPSQTITVEE